MSLQYKIFYHACPLTKDVSGNEEVSGNDERGARGEIAVDFPTSTPFFFYFNYLMLIKSQPQKRSSDNHNISEQYLYWSYF
jgi:hypothetical protein